MFKASLAVMSTLLVCACSPSNQSTSQAANPQLSQAAKSQVALKAAASTTFSTSFGVNMAGADFGNVPGKYGSDYIYPTADELPYFVGKKLSLIRLPIKWERIQPTLLQPLDPIELLRLQTFVSAAALKNAAVLVDIHNYGAYNNVRIGQGSVTREAYADLWRRLSQALVGNAGLGGYDIMNEPVNFATGDAWPLAAQAAVNAIRTVDTTKPIYIEGDCWASAANWQNCNGSLNIKDSANNIIYEAHVYFDKDGSGQYINSYDNEAAYPNVGVDRIAPFVQWLKTNNYRGYIGEYGIPDNDARWLPVLQNAMNYMDQNCLSGTYWAAGPWWGNNALAVEPINGQDRPQMAVLLQHTGQANCSTNGTTPAPALPDMIVTSVSMSPSQPTTGQNVTFTAVVKNQGSVATPAGIVTGVGFLIDGNSASWSAGYSASIPAGASVTLTADGGPTGASVWNATSGNHIFEAFVNDTQRYAESDFTNNKLDASLSVAASSGGLTAGSIVSFGNTNSGLCLDNAGSSKTEGMGITQQACTGGASQKFQVNKNADGSYSFVNQASGLCFDINGASTSNGAKTQQWGCNGTGAQKYRVDATSSGHFRVVNINSGLCVDAPSASKSIGLQYQQYSCNGTAAQDFVIN